MSEPFMARPQCSISCRYSKERGWANYVHMLLSHLQSRPWAPLIDPESSRYTTNLSTKWREQRRVCTGSHSAPQRAYYQTEQSTLLIFKTPTELFEPPFLLSHIYDLLSSIGSILSYPLFYILYTIFLTIRAPTCFLGNPYLLV